MPIIRRVYHFSRVYLCPEILFGKMPACGQSVLVVHGGETVNEHFLGFSAIEDLLIYPGVVITGIAAFTPGNEIAGNWIEHSPKTWFLGSRQPHGVSLVIANDDLIAVGEGALDSPPSIPSNVTQLRPAKTGR